MFNFQAPWGSTLDENINKAIKLNKEYKELIYFNFNNLPFYIDSKSKIKELKTYYKLSCKYGDLLKEK